MAADPVGPRITYYDDATGERIELSTVTLANWAAKTGNLLRDELGAGPGSRVAVLLPSHWQTAAVLFGIWWIGAEVVLTPVADIALCTVDRLPDADDAVGAGEVAVLSLDPFGSPPPTCPSASPITRRRYVCTATRSRPSASRDPHWTAGQWARSLQPPKPRLPHRVSPATTA